tara:strand:+ start:106 stop:462 length:357 start_codon:yes stop_codon:yes gene_type:complete
MTIITKGMGAIAKMALRKPGGISGGRSKTAEAAKGKTRKIIKTYSTGRRQTEYVRPGQPEFKMKPKVRKTRFSQGSLFTEKYPKKTPSKQLRFKFDYPHLKKSAVKKLKTNIKKAQVK